MYHSVTFMDLGAGASLASPTYRYPYKPTPTNYPASEWLTDEQKKAHVGEIFYDFLTGKRYSWKKTTNTGIRIRFDSQCETESVSYDFVQIFYRVSGGYRTTAKLGGTSTNSNTLAGAEIIIPSSDFYLYWKSDVSVTKWGFKIDDISAYHGSDYTQVSSGALPTSEPVSADLGSLPESGHPYGNNEAILYHVETGIAVGYGWEESSGEWNTWGDWHLISETRPAFAQPAPKTKFVEVPGASKKLDFSEGLTGYPLYENREGSLEFTILNSLDGVYREWHEIYADISNAINGKRMRAILEDDPMYFYEGRFSVEDYTPGTSESDPRAKITISYDVEPYKWYVDSSTGSDWLWDPFNFETDVIYSGIFGGIAATTAWKQVDMIRKFVGYAPFSPKFTVYTTTGAGMYIRLVNPTLGIDITHQVQDGEYTFYDFVIYGDDSEIYYRTISGTGSLSIDFRQGRL